MTHSAPCTAVARQRDHRHGRERPTLRRTAARSARLLAWLGWLLLAPASAQAAAELVIAASRAQLTALVHVADAQGLFAAEGVNVRMLACANGQACLDKLFAKTAQLATASELPVVLTSFVRNDYAIVATIGRTAQDIKIVGRKSAGIHTAADLRGKRIGVMKGSSSQYFLDAYLLFNGIDPQEVKVVAASSAQAAPLFGAKQVDAFASYLDRMPPILKALGSDTVVLEDPRIYTATSNLVVDRATLKQRRGDIVKVLRALERARLFIASQPEQANAVLQARLWDPSTTEQTLRTADFRLGLEQSLLSTMAGEARWAMREGHVDKSAAKLPDLLLYIEPDALREAVPTALSW